MYFLGVRVLGLKSLWWDVEHCLAGTTGSMLLQNRTNLITISEFSVLLHLWKLPATSWYVLSNIYFKRAIGSKMQSHKIVLGNGIVQTLRYSSKL